MNQLDEFISYLNEQVDNRSIYVWGGQGQQGAQITETWIKSRETSTANAKRAIALWRKRCNEGYAAVLRAFDCSGLGVYWLYNIKHLWPGDKNANGMMGECEKLTKAQLMRGDWVFRVYKGGSSKGRAYHVGYVVDGDLNVIECMGRDDGVVRRRIDASGTGYWNAFGRPKIFKTAIIGGDNRQYVIVTGGSVNVRDRNNTSGSILGVAHKGDKYPYYLKDGWYRIDYKGKTAWISSRPDLTRLT